MSEPANFTPARYACKGRVYDSADGELNVVLAPIQDDGTLGPDKYYQLTKAHVGCAPAPSTRSRLLKTVVRSRPSTRTTRGNGKTPRTPPPGNSLPRLPRRKMR